MGCRRGTTAQQLEEAFAAFCAASGLSPAAVCAAASIELKKDEPGLAAFCKAHGWPITFYPADELRAEMCIRDRFALNLFWGSVSLTPGAVAAALLGRGEDALAVGIVLQLRLPRAVMSTSRAATAPT